jgi:hypothetical protein
VGNNIVYINYGNAADPISTVAGYLKLGFNGGTWNGFGIVSSVAAANSTNYGVGYADSADAGNPANLPTSTIKIMYTLLGDANLDGIVNGTDFAIVATNFNTNVSGWDQGDFDYNDIVNGTDFGDISVNFNKGINIAADINATPANSAASSSNSNPAANKTMRHSPAKSAGYRQS